MTTRCRHRPRAELRRPGGRCFHQRLGDGDAPHDRAAAFDDLSSDYLGFVIDPAGHLKQTQDNQSNQAGGIDLALLGKQANAQVTTNSSVQQDPSLAVDPTNPNHLVIAYMDYSLENTGYAGIGVAVSTDAGRPGPIPRSLCRPVTIKRRAPTVAFDFSGQVYVSFQAASYL